MSNGEVNNSLTDALQELNKETLLQLLQDGTSDISQVSSDSSIMYLVVIMYMYLSLPNKHTC